MDETASVRLIEAMAAIWTAIRARHPDVPPVVLLAAPAARGGVLGHFAPLRWSAKKRAGKMLHEVVIVAEFLDRPAVEIFGTILHEAAHALNCNRKIPDCTSSQYHNGHYRDAARELGLDVAKVTNYGYAFTTLPDHTAKDYEREITALDAVLVHRRKPPTVLLPTRPSASADNDDEEEEDTKRPSSRNLKATCECGFIIRVTRKTMSSTTIRCDACGEPFRPAS